MELAGRTTTRRAATTPQRRNADLSQQEGGVGFEGDYLPSELEIVHAFLRLPRRVSPVDRVAGWPGNDERHVRGGSGHERKRCHGFHRH